MKCCSPGSSLAVLILCHITPTVICGLTTEISNISPRFAADGVTIMDAHDGNTIQYERGQPFYYYAMGYGLCLEDGVKAEGGCGQTSNNTVGVWSSFSLASGSWKLESSFVPSERSTGWPNCTYFRAHAVRHVVSATSVEYVLFLNGQAGHDNSCTACPPGSKFKCLLAGTSSSPTGPFEYRGVVDVRYTTEGGIGDFSVWVDEEAADGQSPAPAYVIYKRSGAAPMPGAHRMTLQALESSYLRANSSTSAGIFGSPFVEAPDMFRRGATYYAVFGKCCAFCAHGSGIGVYTATHPLGPWTYTSNIGCAAAVTPECGCGMPQPAAYTNGTTCAAVKSVTFAQQNSIIRVPGGAGVGIQFIWTGDRWQSACRSTCIAQGVPPGPRDLGCVKGWDYQYWSLLEWDDASDPPLPRQVRWQDSFKLSIG